MKTKIIVSFVLSLLLVFCYAQQENQTLMNKNAVKADDKNNNQAGTGSNSSTGLMVQTDWGEECSIYKNKNFEKGELRLKDNTVFEDRTYRFNMYTQQMEFILNNDTAAIGNPEELESLEFGDKHFIYDEYVYEDKILKGYLEVLVEGKYRLLLQCKIKYTLREDAFDPTSAPVEKYYLGKQYYISTNNEPAEPIMLDKKDVINSLKVSGKDLKKYIKTNHISMKTESDLVNVISYCNK
jgi:hypothetical protein